MTVLEAVKRSKFPFFHVSGAVKAAQQMISASEEVIGAQAASVAVRHANEPLSLHVELKNPGELPGVLVVTDQRVLFVCSVLGNRTTRELRLSDIRTVDSTTSLGIERLRIATLTEAFITTSRSKLIANLRNAISEARERRNAPRTAAPADDDLSSSDVAQLQALKELYDSGVLTAEEFAAKKAQILGL